MLDKSEGDFFFRNGINELFKIIEDHNIPLFIISAGVKDVIDIVLETLFNNFDTLKRKGLLHIMGNKFIYDEKDNIIGYEKPVITTFNKNTVSFYLIKKFKTLFSELISNQSKIVLLGDHLNVIIL